MSKQPEEFESWFAVSGLGAPHSGNYWAAWESWQASRATALEEAAVICDSLSFSMGDLANPSDCAVAIRALKEQQ